MLGLLIVLTTANAQVSCESGVTHTSLASAVADPGCTDVRLEPGVHREEVVIPRLMTVAGAGTEATWVACDDGPCLTVLPGVALELRDLTLAAEGTTLASWLAIVTIEDVVVAPIGHQGGWLKFNHTDAFLTSVDIDVPARRPPAVQAISTRGHDLEFETVRFFGTEPASGTMSAVYSIAYSVNCTDCSFRPERKRLRPPEPLLELDDTVSQAKDVEMREARWPQLFCPPAGPPERAQCIDQCVQGEEVAQCRMAWDDRNETCHAMAVCVPSGEAMPDLQINREPRTKGFR